MKDIVIPYIRSDPGELDICLEFIKRNVPHRNVHVVEQRERHRYGHIPPIDVTLKLKWAIENLDLTDEFYLFNDDFFVMNPIKETPYFHRGTLRDHISSRGPGPYTNVLKTTLEALTHKYDEPLSYELHTPFLFEKEKLAHLISDISKYMDYGKSPLVRSMYGNIFSVGGDYFEDIKNVSDFDGKTYLSTNEITFMGELGDYIRSKV